MGKKNIKYPISSAISLNTPVKSLHTTTNIIVCGSRKATISLTTTTTEKKTNNDEANVTNWNKYKWTKQVKI